MSKQFTSNTSVRFVAAAALLLAVLTSPVRPSRLLGSLADRDSLSRSFALSRVNSLPTSVKQVPSRLIQVKALTSESEEKELTGAEQANGCSFDLASTPSPKVGGNFLCAAIALTLHPLRC